MAAGRGIRLRPLTDDLPKAMAPYRGTTLIAQGIEQLHPIVDRIHVTVGYKGAMLAEHVVRHGAASVLNTEGRGNCWWLFNTLLSSLSEPVLVLTCDNITELDGDFLAQEYRRVGDPPCMVVPVKPIEGLDGDYITLRGDSVVGLDRNVPSTIYCSGIQVINPLLIREMTQEADSFEGVWSQLIAMGGLKASAVYPKSWYTIDNLPDLHRAWEESGTAPNN